MGFGSKGWILNASSEYSSPLEYGISNGADIAPLYLLSALKIKTLATISNFTKLYLGLIFSPVYESIIEYFLSAYCSKFFANLIVSFGTNKCIVKSCNFPPSIVISL